MILANKQNRTFDVIAAAVAAAAALVNKLSALTIKEFGLVSTKRVFAS